MMVTWILFWINEGEVPIDDDYTNLFLNKSISQSYYDYVTAYTARIAHTVYTVRSGEVLH